MHLRVVPAGLVYTLNPRGEGRLILRDESSELVHDYVALDKKLKRRLAWIVGASFLSAIFALFVGLALHARTGWPYLASFSIPLVVAWVPVAAWHRWKRFRYFSDWHDRLEHRPRFPADYGHIPRPREPLTAIGAISRTAIYTLVLLVYFILHIPTNDVPSAIQQPYAVFRSGMLAAMSVAMVFASILYAYRYWRNYRISGR